MVTNIVPGGGSNVFIGLGGVGADVVTGVVVVGGMLLCSGSRACPAGLKLKGHDR